jgi:Tfp pilus assembly protein PilO
VLTIQEAIAGIARQLGLTLGSRSYSNDAVKGSHSLARFRITMPISGTYPQVASFLQRLEALPHIVTVDSIALHEDSGVAYGRSTNLNVVLSIYFLDREPADAE